MEFLKNYIEQNWTGGPNVVGQTALPMTFRNNDRAYQEEHLMLIKFAGKRRVLSTSAWNGGIREDLCCAFNYDQSQGKTVWCELLEPTIEGHMRRIGENLGLPALNTGLCTAAQIKNMAIACEEWDGVTVTTLATAGIDENGGRAGDPASWQERNGVTGLPAGTINLLIHFDCDLPPGVLAGALLTATEAKCAAIQELQLPSLVSSGIATGSGTDGAVLVCDPTSPIHLSDTGKHSKLGEMIGRTVLSAVKSALFRQTGASPGRLHDAVRLLGRFGLTEEVLAASLPELTAEKRHQLCRREEVWTVAAVCAHLMDQQTWGVLSPEQTKAVGKCLFPVGSENLLNAFISFLAEQSKIWKPD